MSEANGAGTPPAGADLERLEIERIKELLRGMVRDAARNRDGRFFSGKQNLSAAGEDLLGEIDRVVKQELAATAEGRAGE